MKLSSISPDPSPVPVSKLTMVASGTVLLRRVVDSSPSWSTSWSSSLLLTVSVQNGQKQDGFLVVVLGRTLALAPESVVLTPFVGAEDVTSVVADVLLEVAAVGWDVVAVVLVLGALVFNVGFVDVTVVDVVGGDVVVDVVGGCDVVDVCGGDVVVVAVVDVVDVVVVVSSSSVSDPQKNQQSSSLATALFSSTLTGTSSSLASGITVSRSSFDSHFHPPQKVQEHTSSVVSSVVVSTITVVDSGGSVDIVITSVVPEVAISFVVIDVVELLEVSFDEVTTLFVDGGVPIRSAVLEVGDMSLLSVVIIPCLSSITLSGKLGDVASVVVSMETRRVGVARDVVGPSVWPGSGLGGSVRASSVSPPFFAPCSGYKDGRVIRSDTSSIPLSESVFSFLKSATRLVNICNDERTSDKKSCIFVLCSSFIYPDVDLTYTLVYSCRFVYHDSRVIERCDFSDWLSSDYRSI